MNILSRTDMPVSTGPLTPLEAAPQEWVAADANLKALQLQANRVTAPDCPPVMVVPLSLHVKAGQPVPLTSVIEYWKTDSQLREICAKLRPLKATLTELEARLGREDPETKAAKAPYNQLKGGLHGHVLAAASIPAMYRNEANVAGLSGLVPIDVDGAPDQAMAEGWRDSLGALEYLRVVRLSAGGHGIHGAVAVSGMQDHDDYKRAFAWVSDLVFQRTRLRIDPAPSNPASYFYDAFDPELVDNPGVVPLYMEDCPGDPPGPPPVPSPIPPAEGSPLPAGSPPTGPAVTAEGLANLERIEAMVEQPTRRIRPNGGITVSYCCPVHPDSKPSAYAYLNANAPGGVSVACTGCKSVGQQNGPKHRAALGLPPTGQRKSGGGKPGRAPRDPDSLPVWHRVGDHVAVTRLKGTVICDMTGGSEAWWAYSRKRLVWESLDKTDHRITDPVGRQRYAIAQELLDAGDSEAARALGLFEPGKREWSNAVSAPKDDLWAALRLGLEGTVPAPPKHLIGTPDHVVNLRTGLILPHAPELGIRALTGGRFYPESADDLRILLAEELVLTFTPEVLDQYLKLAGLALSGDAQTHRAIAMVRGESGSGKGSSVNLIGRAFGDLAMAVAAAWLQFMGRGDIDATGAKAIVTQPRALLIDEIGAGPYAILPAKLLAATGNSPWTFRKPHGVTVSAYVPAMFWSSCVEPPEMDRRTGIERRLAVLPTIAQIDDDLRRSEEDMHSQALLDAVITWAVLEAADVYHLEYGDRAPAGGAQAKAETLRGMDPLDDWISDLQPTDDTIPVRELYRRYIDETGDGDTTETAFGIAVRLHPDWTVHRKEIKGDRARRAFWMGGKSRWQGGRGGCLKTPYTGARGF